MVGGDDDGVEVKIFTVRAAQAQSGELHQTNTRAQACSFSCLSKTKGRVLQTVFPDRKNLFLLAPVFFLGGSFDLFGWFLSMDRIEIKNVVCCGGREEARIDE